MQMPLHFDEIFDEKIQISNFENGLEGNSNKLSVVSSPPAEVNNEVSSTTKRYELLPEIQ